MRLLLIVLLSGSLLAACGKKADLDAPDGPGTYPRIYPPGALDEEKKR